MDPFVHQKHLDIAVIGGGIAGVTMVIGLLKQNIQVTLYESAHRFGEIGAGVGLAPNAIRAMSMIDPALKEGFDRVATPNQWEAKKDVWFDFRWGMNGETVGKPFHTVHCPKGHATLHRADFLDQMVKLIPSEIVRFGKRVVALEDLGNDGIRLKFRDGSEATHAAVIGCDGINSETRKHVLGSDNPAAYPRFTGKYCHRGLIPEEKAVPLLGGELARNKNMYLGRHGHILTFPVQHGKKVNVVAFSNRETWDSKDWVVPSSREELLADYKGWSETIERLVSLMERPSIWALYEQPPCDTYVRGRVCMMGDAAHASTPHQGAGAGMAIEDAYVLSHLLGQLKDVKGIKAAFKAFDVVRRERTQKLVSTSREAGHLWDLELEGVGGDVDKLKANIDKRMLWIWNENLEAEAELGKQIMSQSR